MKRLDPALFDGRPSGAWTLLRSVMLLFVTLASLFLFAGPTYDNSKHGHPDTGVLRLPDEGRGSCAQCHDNHASRLGVPTGGFNQILFTTDDETLCYSCHAEESAARVYPGNVVWADSTHATSPAAWWRSASPKQRTAADAGKCVNCHDPHGADDASGTIPSMMRLREQQLCLGCHDGNAAKDVATDAAKAYRHPYGQTGRHSAIEAISDARTQYDDSGTEPRRHAECADCHNAHVARTDFSVPLAPEASQRLYGVPRISVTNGFAGSTPTYTWRGAADVFGPREYEVCFKCHSSWTQLPFGSPDLAVLTNPNNPSHHPIQAQGRNGNIAPESFENGLTWDRILYCADCHGSDSSTVKGPHGSSNRYILKRAYPALPATRPMTPSELCFSCHRFDVYADPLQPDATQQLSRFNRPEPGGHAFHVGSQQIPCYTCHVTHGSATHPSLIATGRSPGIVIFSQNASGGSCTPTCHVTRTWNTNYAR